MRLILFLLNFFYYFLLASAASKIIPVQDLNNITISFGSCNALRGNEASDIFYRILENDPDVWVWLGDAYYADVAPFTVTFNGEAIVRAKMENVKNKPAYRALTSKVPVIGVWDDHDYGRNNANKDFAFKELTQKIFLDFLDEPENSPRRVQKGIYDSYYIGDETKIKVILVDVRYFRDPPSIWQGDDKDTLGEVQWNWLEEEIANSKAEFLILGSGSIVLPDDRLFPEHWHEWSREKLFSILKKYKRDKFLIISGDIHYAEVDTYPCPERHGFQLYEITSSGLTHHAGEILPKFGDFASNFFPQTYNGPEDRYIGKNFGLLNFDFENNIISIQIKNDAGDVVIEKKLNKSDLEYRPELYKSRDECILTTSFYYRFFTRAFSQILSLDKLTLIFLGSLAGLLSLIVFICNLCVKLVLFMFRKLIGKKKVE